MSRDKSMEEKLSSMARVVKEVSEWSHFFLKSAEMMGGENREISRTLTTCRTEL